MGGNLSVTELKVCSGIYSFVSDVFRPTPVKFFFPYFLFYWPKLMNLLRLSSTAVDMNLVKCANSTGSVAVSYRKPNEFLLVSAEMSQRFIVLYFCLNEYDKNI